MNLIAGLVDGLAIASMIALLNSVGNPLASRGFTSLTPATSRSTAHLALLLGDAPSQTKQLPYDLNQAKNFARQRGEAENGGVSVYEAEPSMHGPAEETPHVINGDGTVTFTFRGGPLGADFFDVETQVTVGYDEASGWNVVTNYNQEIAPTPVSYAELLETR